MCSNHWRIWGRAAPSPTTAQNVLNFIQFLLENYHNHMLAPPGGSALPPIGNPGNFQQFTF